MKRTPPPPRCTAYSKCSEGNDERTEGGSQYWVSVDYFETPPMPCLEFRGGGDGGEIYVHTYLPTLRLTCRYEARRAGRTKSSSPFAVADGRGKRNIEVKELGRRNKEEEGTNVPR